jgi:4-amino-4-deoxy-L-arabinose transferase-like glycosyltransferase
MTLSFLTQRQSMLWLLVTLGVLRAPGFVFGVLDIDETEFLLIGKMLGEGAIPFVDVVDIKPILAYLFYAPAALFGFEIWPMQVMALGWVFATCLLVGRAARAWTESAKIEAAAAWLCGLASSCNVLSVNTELMANLPAAAALLFFARARKGESLGNDLGAGLCIGLASLFKHQSGIFLVGLLGALAWEAARRRGFWLGRLLALLGGFALPWALVAGIYLSLGHWEAFYEWNVERNLFYVGKGAGSPWGRFAMGLALFVALAAPLLWYFAARESWLRRSDPTGLALALCLWLTWIPVSLGGRFYPHYYLQFVPPLALLAAPQAAALLEQWKGLRRAARLAFSLALIVPVAGYWVYGIARGALGAYPGQNQTARALGQWLREKTPPQATLFVWGHFTPIHYLGERLPGTRYLKAAVHVGDFDPQHLPSGFDLRPHLSRRDLDATLADFERRKPDYVVDTTPSNLHDWGKVQLSLFPELERLLAERYELVATPARCLVYRRRS